MQTFKAVGLSHLHSALILFTLLPCGMPTSEGDRSLMSVMDEIEAKALSGDQTTLTPERIEAINAQNEERVRQTSLLSETRDEASREHNVDNKE